MRNDRKQTLIDLGAEALAEALLETADYSPEVGDLVERLIATPHENIQRFKRKLYGLSQSTDYIDWRGSAGFARKLAIMLQGVKASVDDPLTGIELVTAFFEADHVIFGLCDDSGGDVGEIFSQNARDLFVAYATRYPDKKSIADIILKINQENSYGIRDSLIKRAGECLPEPVMRSMIATLEARLEKEKDDNHAGHIRSMISSLALQIKDTQLYEKIHADSSGNLHQSAIINLTRIYLDSGNIEKAHSYLKRLPKENSSHGYEHKKLLMEIYTRQGDTERLTELLTQEFRSFPCTRNLQALLEVIGIDSREKVLQVEVPLILEKTSLRVSDAEFLISIGMIDEAESYLLTRAEQLNRNNFGNMTKLAEAMESNNRNLVACLIYRSLIVSILDQGITRFYSDGVSYLKKLDKLSDTITDWHPFQNPKVFMDQIVQAHGRKYSFWSKYEVTK